MLTDQHEEKQLQSQPHIVNEAEKQPSLYEVIGIDLEQMRQTLKDVHDIGLSQDDPILMMATIFNICLAEQDKVFQKHQQAITAYLGKTTDKYSQDISKAIAELNFTFKQITTDTVTEQFDNHAQVLTKFKQSLWWPISIAVTSALLNIAVLTIIRFGHG